MKHRSVILSLFALLLAMTCSFNAVASSTMMRGDVTGNNEVDISDVTALIGYLLNGDGSSLNLANADCTLNGEIDISDVTALIGYLLNGTWPDGPGVQTFTVNGVTFKMIKVEGGTFTMGATPEQGTEARDNEKPAHQVTLTKDYFIGQTEVTQALWLAVMGSNPSYYIGENGYGYDLMRPVEKVSWLDCKVFITKLNEMTGKTFRLPTEAEWEFAARGGNNGHGYKYSGSNNLAEVAWYWYSIPSQTSLTVGFGTQTVATKAPNELGLYDMSGNVDEWCEDWYELYSSEAQTNPTGPATGYFHVVHGGTWASEATVCRVSHRGGNYPDTYNSSLGLRLAM